MLPATSQLPQPAPQDSVPPAAQPLYLDLSALGPPHTRTGQTYMPADQPGPSVLAPLRQVPMKDRLVYIHIPFTTNDLNWKTGLLPYRESPQSYVELVQHVMATHKPNVPDLFTLLLTLLSTEEKQQVLKATMAHYKAAREHGIQTNQDAPALWPEPLALFNPNFEVDPNSDQGALILQRAQDSILQGLKLDIPKIVNFHRVHKIIQNLGGRGCHHSDTMCLTESSVRPLKSSCNRGPKWT
uniref:Core shell protein Gag P30 domain-containing protein n=1 Tax=Naja naja TaxID=35670 RepID=A0A8C6XU95_NAJNA